MLPRNSLRWVWLFAGISIFAVSCNRPSSLSDHLPKIGFMQLLEDPQLDQGREGFVKALEQAGLIAGRDYTMNYQCAQGDLSLLPTIVQGFLTDRVRLIATSTTPCMIAAARGTMDLSEPPPVVITIVTSPEEVGIKPVPANLTGFYSPVDMQEFLRVITGILPGPVKRLGLLTNPAEANAAHAAAKLAAACEKAGIELLLAPVSSINDIRDAALSLADRGVQALIGAADNTVYNSMPVLSGIAEQRSLPIFVSEAGITRMGAAVGFGLDYFDWGYQSGTVAAQLLRGKPLAQLPLRPCLRNRLSINEEACQKQGLPLTPALREKIRSLSDGLNSQTNAGYSK